VIACEELFRLQSLSTEFRILRTELDSASGPLAPDVGADRSLGRAAIRTYIGPPTKVRTEARLRRKLRILSFLIVHGVGFSLPIAA
jgi:hypothetical protein